MKRNNIIKGIISSLFLVFITFISCDSFESEPLNYMQDKDVWTKSDSTGTYAQQYLNGIYVQLPTLHNRINNDYLDAGTDDAMPSLDKNSEGTVNSFRIGTLSAANPVEGAYWSRLYTGIRRANIFLANIDDTYLSANLTPNKKIWKAEARFLRAFYYFELIKRWGGVPMVGDKIFGLKDNWNLERSTLEQCTTYILQELDAIENDLYDSKGLADLNIGRATDGAVNALRSRLLLYMASPLYNPSNDVTKWEKAAEAAKKVIDMDAFSLNSDFKALFYTLKNTETIFVREEAQSTTVEMNNSPVGYQTTAVNAKGYTSPSQNLVDAFLTLDGKLITDDDADYDPQNPYANRDPRLALTVFHNGTKWLNRDVETFEGGLDKPNKNLPQTQTGYYLRKFMGAYETASTVSNTHHSYIMFRYAEILLNYAEALNEIDPVANKVLIDNALIQIRQRAKIQPGSDNRYGVPTTTDQGVMREIIRNERRIELAFEEHRFWDIRRWKIAEVVMNEPIKGMEITKSGDTYSYRTVDVKASVFDKNKMYWYPIPYSEIVTNPKMEQNPGWNY